MHDYVTRRPLGNLQLSDLGTIYRTHNIRKNNVNVDLGVLISMHVNDGDCYGSFGNTL